MTTTIQLTPSLTRTASGLSIDPKVHPALLRGLEKRYPDAALLGADAPPSAEVQSIIVSDASALLQLKVDQVRERLVPRQKTGLIENKAMLASGCFRKVHRIIIDTSTGLVRKSKITQNGRFMTKFQGKRYLISGGSQKVFRAAMANADHEFYSRMIKSLKELHLDSFDAIDDLLANKRGASKQEISKPQEMDFASTDDSDSASVRHPYAKMTAYEFSRNGLPALFQKIAVQQVIHPDNPAYDLAVSLWNIWHFPSQIFVEYFSSTRAVQLNKWFVCMSELTLFPRNQRRTTKANPKQTDILVPA